MPEVDFPINAKPFLNTNPTSLGFGNDLGGPMFDGYLDDLGKFYKRPGLSAHISLGTNAPIDGLFWWNDLSSIIAVSDGKLFRIVNSAGNFVELPGATVTPGIRPSFSTNGLSVSVCADSPIVFTDGVTSTQVIDPDAPTPCTHLAYLDGFLLAFEVGGSVVKFADYFGVDPVNWLFADFFSAEAIPDKITALNTNVRTLQILSESSTEFHIFNGVEFPRLNFKSLGVGAMSPYSQVKVGGRLFFFDDNRRLRILAGGQSQIINTSFDKLIQSFEVVDDCTGDYYTWGGKQWLLWQFPTENRTLFYDLQGNYWGEWSLFFSETNERFAFIGKSYEYAKGFNQHMVGSRLSDTILLFDEEFLADGIRPIKASKTILNNNYGTMKPKNSERFKFVMDSGTGLPPGGSETPVAQIRWRINGTKDWSNIQEIPLGKIGDTNFIKTINGTGKFITRDVEIFCTDDVPFSISWAKEDIVTSE